MLLFKSSAVLHFSYCSRSDQEAITTPIRCTRATALSRLRRLCPGPCRHAHVVPEVADTVALVAPSQVASFIALRLIAATGGWVWHARIIGGGRGCHVHMCMYRWRWRERPWVWHRCWGRHGCRGRHGACSRRVCCIVGILPLDLLQGMPNSNDCTAQVVAHDGQDILEEGKFCTRDRCKPKLLRVL